jgi:quinol monooxygenase YgiN
MDKRKYIVGWLTFRPGKRAEFMEIALPYVAACRQEPGCLFFEMSLSPTDSDVVLAMECFQDAEAHTTHLKTPEFQAFWRVLDTLCLHGTFENVFAGSVIPDSATFGGPAPPAVTY